MMNQREMIMKYIDDFGSITPIEAFKDLGIMRLSARTWDIEHKDGIKLTHTKIKSRNRYGKPISFTRYSREVQDGES